MSLMILLRKQRKLVIMPEEVVNCLRFRQCKEYLRFYYYFLGGTDIFEDLFVCIHRFPP